MNNGIWEEAEKFRTRVFLLFASWIPFGLLVAVIWVKVLGLELNVFVGFGVLLFWPFLYLRMRRKFKQLELKCPSCGKLAFDDVPNIVTNIKCANCGFQKGNSLNK